uniref:Uncharacterized protein n=1 Tax=Sus scrofa TaxID=9823 RepID=A0A4X1ULZ4_PIG
LIYFITISLFLLVPFAYFSHLPTPPLWQPTVCSLYQWVCFCFVRFHHLSCFLDSIFKCNITVSVFISFLSSKLYSRSIHAVTYGKIFFYCYFPQHTFFSSTVKHGDPVTHTCIHNFFSHCHALL